MVSILKGFLSDIGIYECHAQSSLKGMLDNEGNSKNHYGYHLIIEHAILKNVNSDLSGLICRNGRNTNMDRIGKKAVKCKWKFLWWPKQIVRYKEGQIHEVLH